MTAAIRTPDGSLHLAQVAKCAAMGKTEIEWADYSFNPLRAINKNNGKVGWACQKIATGCMNCYAEAMNIRFGTGLAFDAAAMKNVDVVVDEQRLAAFLAWKRPKGFVSKDGSIYPIVFAFDMTDLYGEWVKNETLDRLYAAFALRPDLQIRILTKRGERMADYCATWGRGSIVMRKAPPSASFLWPLPNVMHGVSVSNQKDADELLPHLLRVPGRRFVSYEPVTGPVDFAPYLQHEISGLEPAIDHLIFGVESGSGRRHDPAALNWATQTVGACKEAGVPCFVKQLPCGVGDAVTGEVDLFPPRLQVREWPR